MHQSGVTEISQRDFWLCVWLTYLETISDAARRLTLPWRCPRRQFSVSSGRCSGGNRSHEMAERQTEAITAIVRGLRRASEVMCDLRMPQSVFHLYPWSAQEAQRRGQRRRGGGGAGAPSASAGPGGAAAAAGPVQVLPRGHHPAAACRELHHAHRRRCARATGVSVSSGSKSSFLQSLT